MMHAGRLCVIASALALATACDGRRAGTVRATIDMRCRSNADCPAGFACANEFEHGPPITLCESEDPDVVCPPGYDTKVRYGQRFCRPHRTGGAPLGPGTVAATARRPLASGAGESRAAR